MPTTCSICSSDSSCFFHVFFSENLSELNYRDEISLTSVEKGGGWKISGIEKMERTEKSRRERSRVHMEQESKEEEVEKMRKEESGKRGKKR